jgi:CheY-like chemotaxis protein
MSPLNLENKRVLVVEDDDMSFIYLNHLFLLTRATVMRKKTGVDAIDEFRNDRNFDFILMDIQLPDMDGIQVTREIRKISRAVPIIAQTASRSGPERELMIEAGCSFVLTKPFSMEQLFETMEKYI